MFFKQKSVQDVIQEAGEPDEIEILDCEGVGEYVCLIYEQPPEYYKWKGKKLRENKYKKNLSEREMQIVKELALGKTYEQVAEELMYSRATIRRDASNIIEKVGAQNIKHAIFLIFASKKHKTAK